MKKRLLIFCAIFSVFITNFAFTYAAVGEFKDVGEEYWAYNDIKYFAQKGVVSGIGYGRFDPEGEVTREQFAKMMCIAFEIKEVTPKSASFSDVDSSMWSYSYIEASKDYLAGYQSKTGSSIFKPETPATREEIAAALVKIMKINLKELGNSETQFNDNEDISSDSKKYISAAIKLNLIKGYSDNTFKPQKSVTRAEAITLISRALNNNKNSSGGSDTKISSKFDWKSTDVGVVVCYDNWEERTAANLLYPELNLNKISNKVIVKDSTGEGPYTQNTWVIIPKNDKAEIIINEYPFKGLSVQTAPKQIYKGAGTVILKSSYAYFDPKAEAILIDNNKKYFIKPTQILDGEEISETEFKYRNVVGGYINLDKGIRELPLTNSKEILRENSVLELICENILTFTREFDIDEKKNVRIDKAHSSNDNFWGDMWIMAMRVSRQVDENGINFFDKKPYMDEEGYIIVSANDVKKIAHAYFSDFNGKLNEPNHEMVKYFKDKDSYGFTTGIGDMPGLYESKYELMSAYEDINSNVTVFYKEKITGEYSGANDDYKELPFPVVSRLFVIELKKNKNITKSNPIKYSISKVSYYNNPDASFDE